MINIEEIIGLSSDIGILLRDEQLKEEMKFDSEDIDISTVNFRLETAERIFSELEEVIREELP